MSWTDERIELLKSLWSDGKSASEISDMLGNVTRNAVIGKAHRLGLSGRPSPIKKVKPEPKGKKSAVAVPVKEVKSAAKPVVKGRVQPVRPAVKATPAPVVVGKRSEKSPSRPVVAPVQPAAHVKGKKNEDKVAAAIPLPVIPLRPEPKIDPSKLVSLLNLSERMCRWPVGDPKEAEFGFCGQPVAEGHLYCGAHVAMAYQISTKKSDERAKAEKRRKMALAAQMAMEDEEEEEIDAEVDVENLDDIDAIEDDGDTDDINSGDIS